MKHIPILILFIGLAQVGLCQEASSAKIDRIKSVLAEIKERQKELSAALADVRKSSDPAADLTALGHIWSQIGNSPKDQIRGAIGFLILDTPKAVYALNKEGVENLDAIIKSELSVSPLISGILVGNFVDVQDPKTFSYTTPERFKNPLGGQNYDRYREMFTSSIQSVEIGMKAAEFIQRDLKK